MNVLNVLIGSIAAALGMFIGAIMSTLCGGIVGWCIALVFPDVIGAIGGLIEPRLTSFEVGAVIGFVGGLFRRV